MSGYDHIPVEFSEWVIRLLEGSITDEQFAQLDYEMEHNEAALIHYFEFISTYAGLTDLGQASPVPTVLFDEKDEPLSPEELFDFFKPAHPIKLEAGKASSIYSDSNKSEEEKKRQIEDYARQQLEAFLAREHRANQEPQFQNAGWDFSLIIDNVTKASKWLGRKSVRVTKAAAVYLAVLLFILLSLHFYKTFTPYEIATLNTSLNARFAGNQNLVSGERLTKRKAPLLLQTGLIEIIFDRGAKVLLEAPAMFQLKSADRIILHTGQLFAFVPNYAQGFTVETPNSRIVDRGTEFGVRVEQNGTSDLHLFTGKATLTSDSGSRAGRTLTLTAGQAKRVDASGYVKDIPIKKQEFVRHFYSETGFIWRGQRLCLADIAGKGNGLGTGQTNVYVDPIEGYKDSLYCSGKGNEYHPLAANPFIDGLFIPDGSKKQIVSSHAHEFANCPKTNGECYATAGANPIQGVWATNMRNGIIQFAGQDYGNREHPCIVMHANLGITFDLSAIRAMCPDIKMTRFVSQFGIADFEETAGCNADFWVLIDGQVRESRRHITQKNVLIGVSVELSPFDRFLTLVTTDGEDIDRMGAYQRSYTCDWCVFVEPALLLETGDK
ncbi:MAG: hypothetical protein A2167_02345 [Planctomycetes bacterium RBG_13_46_10]|nr:MAG: hypothetical protein A2167_02345 [Planctomycetes bacterium RBG_13_46_10]